MNKPHLPPLTLIAGPTASGKSALALRLAAERRSVIVNADAMQVYADLRILTARPSPEDEAAVPHRLFGHVDGATAHSAAAWAAEARAVLAEIWAEGQRPILVGGTGLYIRTLLDGIAPVPPIDPEVRAAVRAMPVGEAYDALKQEDAAIAARLNAGDSTRIARALEVIRSTGRSLLAWREERVGGIGADVALDALVLDPPRDTIIARSEVRIGEMIASGAIAEVADLLARKLDPTLPIMRAIGVPPLLAYLGGSLSLDAATEEIRYDTKAYIKRQYTWARGQFPAAWTPSPKTGQPLHLAVAKYAILIMATQGLGPTVNGRSFGDLKLMKLFRSSALAALCVGALASTPAAAAGSAAHGLVLLKELNSVVLGNLQVNGGETEGKLYVGGNVTGNSFQVGFGSHANGQSMTESYHSTFAVGGSVDQTVQVENNQTTGGHYVGSYNGSNSGAYGAYIAGNYNGTLNVNNEGGTFRVGGNLQQINGSVGSTLYVAGNLNNNLDLRDNMNANIGGNVSTIQGNSNGTVRVTGNVQTLQFGGAATAVIGGTLNNANLSSNQKVSVAGNINGGSLGNNNVVKSGGSISNVNGSNGTTVYALGSISGNANGASFNPNYVYNATVTAPTIPAAPVVGSLATTTAGMIADLRSLSSTFGAMATTAGSGIIWTPNNQTAIIHAVAGTGGYAVLNVDASIFSAQQFYYDFGTTAPVIINVKGSSSYFMQANFLDSVYNQNTNTNYSGSSAQAHNQNVIWNFGDATSVVLDRKFQGSVLAPYANLVANVVEGSLVALNFTQKDEVHLGTFKGDISLPGAPVNAVPEPANWALMIAGFGLIGGTVRRRRAVARAA